MKLLYCVFAAFILIVSEANSIAQTNDSLKIKIKKIKELYLLSTDPSRSGEIIYQQEFFDEFPNTFKELNELYGYENNTPAPLYFEVDKHIYELFNNLKTINDTLYYKKIISIAIGGHWDADAVNFFQDGLRKRVLSNPELTVSILKDMPDNKIKSFWRFYFDGPAPDLHYDKGLDKIKSIDERIYKIMIQAYKDVLNDPDWKGFGDR